MIKVAIDYVRYSSVRRQTKTYRISEKNFSGRFTAVIFIWAFHRWQHYIKARYFLDAYILPPPKTYVINPAQMDPRTLARLEKSIAAVMSMPHVISKPEPMPEPEGEMVSTSPCQHFATPENKDV